MTHTYVYSTVQSDLLCINQAFKPHSASHVTDGQLSSRIMLYSCWNTLVLIATPSGYNVW